MITKAMIILMRRMGITITTTIIMTIRIFITTVMIMDDANNDNDNY